MGWLQSPRGDPLGRRRSWRVGKFNGLSDSVQVQKDDSRSTCSRRLVSLACSEIAAFQIAVSPRSWVFSPAPLWIMGPTRGGKADSLADCGARQQHPRERGNGRRFFLDATDGEEKQVRHLRAFRFTTVTARI